MGKRESELPASAEADAEWFSSGSLLVLSDLGGDLGRGTLSQWGGVPCLFGGDPPVSMGRGDNSTGVSIWGGVSILGKVESGEI